MNKLPYKATIYDGHTHIERRVYEDENEMLVVKINGWFFKVIELRKRYDITIYYDPMSF